MKGDNHVEEQTAALIKTLEDGPDKKGTRTIVAVSIGIWTAILGVVFYSEILPIPEDLYSDTITLVTIGVFLIMVPFAPVFAWNEWKGVQLVKLVARDYYKYFENPKDQLAANAIMLKTIAHASEKPLLANFRVKVGAITKKFCCSECGRSVRTRSFSSSNLICENCHSNLLVETPSNCPRCESNDVALCNPKQLVGPLKPDHATQGLGLYGQLLDLIYDPFRRAIRLARIYLTSHSFKCGGCGMAWATRLPSLDGSN